MWFPKPAAPEDIRITEAAGSPDSASRLFDALHAADAVEWRHKVGVVGAVDGSAKSSSRLLISRGWVLKTNVDFASHSEDAIIRQAREAARLASRSRLWHPQKIWASYRAEECFYPLSATPELETLRRLRSEGEKFRGWSEMIELGVELASKNGIGLDLNPSNFGRVPSGSRLYYIDDEWYPRWQFSEFAGALVSRIPEEPGFAESRWNAWGGMLCSILEPLCPEEGCWDQLLDAMAAYPVAPQFRRNRDELCSGVASVRARRRKRRREQVKRATAPIRTAVLGDVHGNSAALEAVLRECRALQVDSYLFLGDAVGYGPMPRQCVQRLAELPNAVFVRGNHDHAIGTGILKDGMNGLARSCAEWTHAQLSRDERQWLLTQAVEERGPGWMAVHGAPRDPRRFLAYVYELTYDDNLEHLSRSGVSLCFCGHTHVQFVHASTDAGESCKLGAPARIELADHRVLLINPGSVGQPRDGDPRAAFALWDRARNVVSLHRVAYSIEPMIQALTKAGLPAGLGERLLVGA